MFWSHPAENGSPPALQSHIQSHIQSKMADLQPSSHVREKSGAICKIPAKIFSARSALSRHADQKITSRITSMQNSEDSSHIYHILNHIQESHPSKIQRPVTSASGHIRKNIRTKSSHFQGATLAAARLRWRHRWPAAMAARSAAS